MKPFVLQQNKWRIAPDGSRSYMLQRAKIEKGKLRWRTDGFYSTLEACLRGYQRRLVLESDEALPEALADSIQDLQTAVDQLRTSLTITL